ncbi:MAG: hypothetical protein IKZ58_10350 [Selenomonadaceae bacterium]|nr:hypothetical protein [Selenomonadaceae bacterium]
MIKALIMFVFGNALWDKLVEYFGSTEAVVEAAIIAVIVALIIKFHKEILSFAIVILILWIIFH